MGSIRVARIQGCAIRTDIALGVRLDDSDLYSLDYVYGKETEMKAVVALPMNRL